jgi:hypothetical protein
MANHSVKTVSSTPVLLSPDATHSGADVVVQNNSDGDLYLGSSSVTTSVYGFKLSPGTGISLRLGGREELYGVASSSININVLTVGLV